jgi:hypothetical protein
MSSTRGSDVRLAPCATRTAPPGTLVDAVLEIGVKPKTAA